MNYFELYHIPVSFSPDATIVKNKFYELSRQYHPDRFTMADDTSKTDALRMSAMNNDAYKTLSNPYSTMGYILRINDMLEDEEKYTLPPDFLMEMMELNEAVSEYEMEPDDISVREEAEKAISTQFEYWNTEVSPLIKKYESTQDKKILSDIKDYYFRKKYLLRIQDRIATFAARQQ